MWQKWSPPTNFLVLISRTIDVLPYRAKRKHCIIKCVEMGRFLDCPGEPKVITQILNLEKLSWLGSQLEGEVTVEECSERCNTAGIEDEIRGSQGKQCGQPIVAQKSKETDSSLEPPGKNTALPIPTEL